MLIPNTILQGRYQIIRQLGAGGMGAVYLAQHLGLNRQVAVKENFSPDAAALAQFQTEASILANLQHNHLPRVTDFFVEPNGTRYLVMDYIEGQNLEQVVQQRGALPENVVRAWMAQIFDAVKYLHANNIIHRDIKPQNIIITPRGKAMLVDFGIAKIHATGAPTLFGARALGSPGYAPPEQYSGGTDARSDVYALGATMYFALTGRPPEESPRRAAGVPLTEPRLINGAISPSANAVIVAAMNMYANQRYASVAAMEQALNASAPTVPTYIPQQPAVIQPSVSVTPAATTHPAMSLKTLYLVFGSLLVTLMLALGVLMASKPELIFKTGMAANTPTATVVATATPATPPKLADTQALAVVATATPATPPKLADTQAPAAGVTIIVVTATPIPPTRTPTATATPPGPQKRLDALKYRHPVDGKDYTSAVDIFDLNTRSQSRLDQVGEGRNISSAAWSIDGKKILITWFEIYIQCYSREFCVTRPLGGSLQSIIVNGSGKETIKRGERGKEHLLDAEHLRDALWSPDGKKITVRWINFDGRGNSCPVLLNHDGTGTTKLPYCEADDHPRFWSVDGKWIIAWSVRGLKLYAYEVDGTRRVPLEQLGKIQVYDQRYWPWRVTDSPVCKGASFWDCE